MKELEFNVWSPDSILKYSHLEVTESDLYGKHADKSLRSEVFGKTSQNGRCTICNKFWTGCPGHWGHIDLASPVFHVGWMNAVLYWCRITCHACGRVQENKSKCCMHCKATRTHVVKSDTYALTENKKPLDASGVLDWFESIPMDDVQKMTNHPTFHPKHLILTRLPVPPNQVRPSPMLNDSEIHGEDDITRRLLLIVRVNKSLKRYSGSLTRYQRNKLEEAVNAYLDHTKIPARRKYSKKASDQKSLAERLRHKKGRIRGNLMGKRVNHSARSVISGDAQIGMDEVGVPRKIADNMTVTETINAINIEHFQKLVDQRSEKIKYVIEPPNQKIILAKRRGNITLDYGWKIERSLKDGDLVLFNRQPSLHKMSIMCHKVKVMPGSTFRLNLSCTTPYNADCK